MKEIRNYIIGQRLFQLCLRLEETLNKKEYEPMRAKSGWKEIHFL